MCRMCQSMRMFSNILNNFTSELMGSLRAYLMSEAVGGVVARRGVVLQVN
jgi:hypothetical protein